MILKSLKIDLQTYGLNKGMYEGVAEFESEHGKVSVRIGDGHAHRILELCGDAIILESEKVAKAMIAPLIEMAPPPEFVRVK